MVGFARVKRHREDKSATEADTIATVRALYEGQLHRKAAGAERPIRRP